MAIVNASIQLMFSDLEHSSGHQIVSPDLCIIGAGAAGITLAREFLGRKESIVVLEAGGEGLESANADLYQSHILGQTHIGIHAGRARAFGGTTLLWAGQALPLFPLDFAKRHWIPYSGWPITLKELSPFYRRAEGAMQIREVDYGPGTWPTRNLPPYNDTKLVSAYSQFAAEPNFAVKYGSELKKSQNINVFLHANVTSIEAESNARRVIEVRASSLGGRTLTARPKSTVLCVGGIETARLLLISNSVEKKGIGNHHDLVGRFFQDHPHVNAPITVLDPRKFHDYCDSFRMGNIRISLKMVASDGLQRREEIPNVGAEVYYPTGGEEDPLTAAKTFLKALRDAKGRERLIPSLRTMARDPGKILSAAYRYYVRNQPASVGSTDPHIGFFCEQEPNRNSRVMLSNEKDSLGMNRTALDWKLMPSVTKAVHVLASTIADEWGRLGIGCVTSDASFTELGSFTDINHHIGTARMGLDREESVVDTECRVHGYDNFYIASSATFPTGGFSNPTLTVLALTLRIADHLKRYKLS